MRNKESTRILIDQGNGKKRLLCHLVILKNKNGTYEYKFTFPQENFTFSENAHISSTKGILKLPTKITNKQGRIEVGYHSGGRIAYKNVYGEIQQNFKWYSSVAFKKIKKHNLFLRINVKKIKLLPRYFNFKPEDTVLQIAKLEHQSFAIDFYLTKQQIVIKPQNEYKNNYQFDFFDEQDQIGLVLHFYRAINVATTLQIQIISSSISFKFKSYCIYVYYSKFLPWAQGIKCFLKNKSS